MEIPRRVLRRAGTGRCPFSPCGCVNDNIQDLHAGIEHCRDLVLLSEERGWLVSHFVDLRFSLQQMAEAQEQLQDQG